MVIMIYLKLVALKNETQYNIHLLLNLPERQRLYKTQSNFAIL